MLTRSKDSTRSQDVAFYRLFLFRCRMSHFAIIFYFFYFSQLDLGPETLKTSVLLAFLARERPFFRSFLSIIKKSIGSYSQSFSPLINFGTLKNGL